LNRGATPLMIAAMPTTCWLRIAVSCTLCLAPAAGAGAATLALRAGGLAAPVYVTHAGDHTGRLFVVEQAGTVRLLRPGEAVAQVFLDIRGRVLAGGEQGLLGLAFHPLYEQNGRFFVYYTRRGDGAIVISEFAVSGDPDRALPDETVLLVIPHPFFGNHNGGMLAFGPGGYLFAGVGDGGSANDPFSNAQNVDTLLGKILRINVDVPDRSAGTPYSAPTTNPFVGGPGRDEIYAYGLRNPWRFSFDRQTGWLWVGDVGQNAHEEVNATPLAGRNFGWRIFEGFSCTGNDAGLCRARNYTAPLFDYGHTEGRCSITGGYVYRGFERVVPRGTYLYADFCTGEIFRWAGRRQEVLLKSGVNVTSFGEDESGELYVTGGTGVWQIVR
jgi:hypothetical protein